MVATNFQIGKNSFGTILWNSLSSDVVKAIALSSFVKYLYFNSSCCIVYLFRYIFLYVVFTENQHKLNGLQPISTYYPSLLIKATYTTLL